VVLLPGVVKSRGKLESEASRDDPVASTGAEEVDVASDLGFMHGGFEI
jgi:hypothetical protein